MDLGSYWTIFAFVVLVAALVDIIRFASVWEYVDEAPLWLWVVGVLLCSCAGIYWWFSQTRNALAKEKGRRGRLPSKAVGAPEATDEQVEFLANLLRSKGLPDAEANGVAFVISQRYDGPALYAITDELGARPTADECRAYITSVIG